MKAGVLYGPEDNSPSGQIELVTRAHGSMGELPNQRGAMRHYPITPVKIH